MVVLLFHTLTLPNVVPSQRYLLQFPLTPVLLFGNDRSHSPIFPEDTHLGKSALAVLSCPLYFQTWGPGVTLEAIVWKYHELSISWSPIIGFFSAWPTSLGCHGDKMGIKTEML